MSITWSDVEDAIRAWVKSGSGLADAKVIWADQPGNRPSAPYVTIRIGDLLAIGHDSVTHDYDDEADAGEEITFTVRGTREFTVTVQTFTSATVNTGTAREYLSKVQTALSLPSVRSAFAAAGISAFDSGTLQNLSALRDAEFEGRAVLDVRFYVAEEVTEVTGYIATVEVTDTEADETFTVELE